MPVWARLSCHGATGCRSFFFLCFAGGCLSAREGGACFVCPIHCSNTCFYSLVDCVVLARARLTNFPHPYFRPAKQKKTRMLKLSKTRKKTRAAPRKQAVLHTNMTATGHGESNYSGLVAGRWVDRVPTALSQQLGPAYRGQRVPQGRCHAPMPRRDVCRVIARALVDSQALIHSARERVLARSRSAACVTAKAASMAGTAKGAHESKAAPSDVNACHCRRCCNGRLGPSVCLSHICVCVCVCVFFLFFLFLLLLFFIIIFL